MRRLLPSNFPLAAILALVLAGFAPSPAHAQGTLTDLQTFPGGSDAQAYDVNDGGRVVGGATTADGFLHAFLCIPGTNGTSTMFDLGTLPGGVYSAATGINNRGQIVGWSLGADGYFRAFLWSPSTPNGTTGSMVDLGTRPGGTGAVAYGINDAGQVVGYWSFPQDLDQDGLEDFRAFMWKPTTANGASGTMVDLGTLPGHVASIAYAINGTGTAAGWSFNGVDAYQAVIWSPAAPNSTSGALASLGVPAGDDSTFAYDINDSGQVVGDSAGATVSALLWLTEGQTANASQASIQAAAAPTVGTAVPLGTFGGTSSGASGINNVGQVVGWFDTDAGEFHAYLWSPAVPNGTLGQIVDLSTLPGGTESQGREINNIGQVVGISTIESGELRPFLLASSSRPEGFYTPISLALQPEGTPCPASMRSFQRNSTLPLSMRVLSGVKGLGPRDVAFAPRIVALKRNGAPLDLNRLDLDSGKSNGNTKDFRFIGIGGDNWNDRDDRGDRDDDRDHSSSSRSHGSGRDRDDRDDDDGRDDLGSIGVWFYNLSTKDLSKGTYELVVEIPDGGRWKVCFVLK